MFSAGYAIVLGMKDSILNRRMRYVFNPSLIPAIIAVQVAVGIPLKRTDGDSR